MQSETDKLSNMDTVSAVLFGISAFLLAAAGMGAAAGIACWTFCLVTGVRIR